MDSIGLCELNQIIQDTIKTSLDNSFWVKAEIAQIKENFSGHCYLELVEKTPLGDKIIAQSKAMIWGNTYRILKPYFQTTTNRSLTAGLKILIRVKIDFHPVFGLSLVITDIDPAYTAGDLALRKAETIKRLKDDGIFDMNREVELPLVPQRIALISSETAAGHLDFVSHLKNNPYKYNFQITLFQAFMQGEKAELSIIEALNEIYNNIDDFDIVAIIRGGGSQTDLNCFDTYDMACNVAQFPLPVITGIGHEQDDSVVDMVACLRMKTPTAAAAYLIDTLYEFESLLDEKKEQVVDFFTDYLNEQKQVLAETLHTLPTYMNKVFNREQSVLQHLSHKLNNRVNIRLTREVYKNKLLLANFSNGINRYLSRQESNISNKLHNLRKASAVCLQNSAGQIKHYESIALLSDPQHILKKGFSITLLNNRPITDASAVKAGDLISTHLYKGTVESTILPSNNND